MAPPAAAALASPPARRVRRSAAGSSQPLVAAASRVREQAPSAQSSAAASGGRRFVPSDEFPADLTGELPRSELVAQVEEGRLPPAPTPRNWGASNLSRLCAQPLLSADDERALFRQMNFRKFRVEQLRQAQTDAERELAKPARRAALNRAIREATRRAERLRNHLIVSNVRLAVSLAKKFVSPETSLESAVSGAIWSLLHAVEKFDYSRGFRFSTYATQAIRRDLYRLVVKNHAHRQRFGVSVDEQLSERNHPALAQEPQSPHGAASYGKLLDMIGRLDPREQFILKTRFGFENPAGRKATYVTIGEELGVSKERVRQIAERALVKLREWAPEFGLESP